jgi:aspartyl-tRNA(Asn)/glutamyl-tRNA(Gln) amidotransferase subunit C
MANITREDVIKFAQLSRINIQESEIDELRTKMQAVLTYAQRVQEVVPGASQISMPVNSNVWREDQIIPVDPEPLLNNAPETQEHYFVVPAVLDNE